MPSNLKAGSFIDLQPENIRTRVVPGYVQVELPFGDLARIDIGGKDLLTGIIRPYQDATERIDNQAAAGRSPVLDTFCCQPSA
jgi:hypothetical protein